MNYLRTNEDWYRYFKQNKIMVKLKIIDNECISYTISHYTVIDIILRESKPERMIHAISRNSFEAADAD